MQIASIASPLATRGRILRLIDSEGGPNVKLSATEDGSGLVLGGNAGYVQMLSRYASPTVRIVNKDGREAVMDAKARPQIAK